MDRVTEAINKGQCVLAVSGALLRDAQVMLALRERGALPSVALSGQATSPVRGISVDAVSRAIGAKGGLLVLVEPDGCLAYWGPRPRLWI